MKRPEQTRKEILAAIKELPLLSPATAQVITIINDPDHALADIIKVIQHDSALTANILKAANSAIYGFRSPVTSVEKAISLMGEEAVVELALYGGTSSVLNSDLKGYEGAEGELWDHDLFSAIASRKIANLSKEPLPVSLLFTGGLLHDVGKAVLSRFLGTTGPRILNAIDKGNVASYEEAERRIMGIDHAEAGFELARHWNLPPELQDQIRFHHQPDSAPEESKGSVYCVHIGDIIAMMAGHGTGADALSYRLHANYTDYIDLSKEGLLGVMLDIEDEYKKVREALFPEEGGGH